MERELTCPVCGSMARCVPSTHVYAKDFRSWVWVCDQFPTCDTYVGCHKGSSRPLGTLADARLRWARMQVHDILDSVWKTHKGIKKGRRNDAYRKLAKAMQLEPEACHVGMFDYRQCQQALKHLGPKQPKPLPSSPVIAGRLYVPTPDTSCPFDP